MKKPEGNYFIQIRFNLMDTDGTRKWRIIMDGLEFLIGKRSISLIDE
jgi:hypothetical protein